MSTPTAHRLGWERYAESLRADSEAFASAIEVGDLTAPVPSCPWWDVADLAWHLAEVQWFWGEIVERRLQDPDDAESAKPPRPADGDLSGWFRSASERLQRVLSETDPDEEVWSWAGPAHHNVAFARRRQAHEAAVHRWDAQSVSGDPRPIAADVAADGVDEFLELQFDPGSDRGRETVHLHATDGEAEWFVRVADGDFTWTREHDKGDVAVRAPVSDLLLLLWRRVRPAAVEVLGDADALERFLARADLT